MIFLLNIKYHHGGHLVFGFMAVTNKPLDLGFFQVNKTKHGDCVGKIWL
jgi:hypothetical protein